MQRFALAAIFAALIAAFVALVYRSMSRSIAAGDNSGNPWKDGPMPKLAFFLLLCLIIYVSLNGAG